jgi:hypothetical protein
MIMRFSFRTPRWLPLSQWQFVLTGIAATVVIRLVVILLTPSTADFSDPRIYQGTGQTVLAGVNPYNFADKVELRAQLRAKMARGQPDGANDIFTRSQETWNYYVSGNLPASTALYALFEVVSNSSRTVWRLLLMLGDVAIFLSLISFLKSLTGTIESVPLQLGVLCLAVINPLLIVDGCAIPEDKQFQTALMLYATALLCARGSVSDREAIGTGLILSLSVLFKLFGIFLMPLWLVRARNEGRRYTIGTLLGLSIPVLVAFAAFGHYFVHTMSARAMQNSVQGPEHSSPWALFPEFVDHSVGRLEGSGAASGASSYVLIKATTAALYAAAVFTAFLRRRIDLLNLCAGLAVVFACLWLDKGALNRMNIAMVFAVAALASLSIQTFMRFAAGMVLMGTLGYAVGIPILRLHLTTLDGIFTLLFLAAYLTALLTFDRSRASPPRAAVQRA